MLWRTVRVVFIPICALSREKARAVVIGGSAAIEQEKLSYFPVRSLNTLFIDKKMVSSEPLGRDSCSGATAVRAIREN
ncbi:hypothetical protein SAMN05443144_12823 [Fodinibius roseus]|uniref:Uncharacterized protein n=1 Tax=Fodinibius roseus TaxID=1194090 RepID=A0A1M5JRA6_9BACT|nr:hypothetical protein [Fodinibius roseus]SHG43116.1 hypothetical protein SAMN05443144_12823 [Fodinibius roseus]